MRRLNIAIKHASDVVLLEKCLPYKIREWQSEDMPVFVITGRSPGIAPPTIRALDRFGIDFGKSKLPKHEFESIPWADFSSSIVYRDGIFFTDGADKGLVLSRILRYVTKKPTSIQIFDDLERHVRAFQRAMFEWDLPAEVFQFRAPENPPADIQMKIADIQLDHFLQRGLQPPILSDAKALELLKSGGENCPMLLSSDIASRTGSP